MTDKMPVTSPSAPPAGPYSLALAVGEWVFLAGQTTVGAALPGGAKVEITATARRSAQT